MRFTSTICGATTEKGSRYITLKLTLPVPSSFRHCKSDSHTDISFSFSFYSTGWLLFFCKSNALLLILADLEDCAGRPHVRIPAPHRCVIDIRVLFILLSCRLNVFFPVSFLGCMLCFSHTCCTFCTCVCRTRQLSGRLL